MKRPDSTDEKAIAKATRQEGDRFAFYYLWLQEHMPDRFFKEIEPEEFTLFTHYLMGFSLQDYFCKIHFKDHAFVLALDSPDVDLRVLCDFHLYGIGNYRTFISNAPAPFPGIKERLRIAIISFTSYSGTDPVSNRSESPLSKKEGEAVYAKVREEHSELTREAFYDLLQKMDGRFLRTLTKERLVLVLLTFMRAKLRDRCQYEIRYNRDWKTKKGDVPSVQLVFSWRNAPKYRFIYRLAKIVFRHRLNMTRVSATYIDLAGKSGVLSISLGLHGIEGKAAWEEADLADFLRELVTLKCFPDTDVVEKEFVDPGLVSGNQGNLIRICTHFVHQTLVHADVNRYSLSNVEEGIRRHPELTIRIVRLFHARFHPETHDEGRFVTMREDLLTSIGKLDTGNEYNDTRRRNILNTAISFVTHTLKTNFFIDNKSSFSFRLDSRYLDEVPFDRKRRFPVLPFAIFFVQGMYFIGFHIRFKDLSRGGVRTVFPGRFEQMTAERNNVFTECYDLAYTQHRKNKDIPEGGSKGIIFLEPYERLLSEIDILRKELIRFGLEHSRVDPIVETFRKNQRTEYLYQAQRAFISALIMIINCRKDGTLKEEGVVDYFGKPEYLYLGPDENMYDEMIEWIARYGKERGYMTGAALISGKPGSGINHKEYGVTSLGVNVYMEAMLNHLGIDPKTEPFTVKISGGPDGDVAGNQIVNLYRFFPDTAKLLAITDGSGTIYDPEGLDLAILTDLFYRGKPIAFYPPKKLHDGGLLLDPAKKKEESAYATKTLCLRKTGGRLVENYLSGSEMNRLYRYNVLRAKTDIFIPAGGRPRTLHGGNYEDFFDADGTPSSRGIVEGANLYLSPSARRALEKEGVLIIQDSSANKGGVICSSIEVLCGLVLTEEEFIAEKPVLMEQVLDIIKERAESEARLLFKASDATGMPLTEISALISEKINAYTYEIFDALDTMCWTPGMNELLTRALFALCPPLLARSYGKRVLEKLPSVHKKAMIACRIASKVVYEKGIEWAPSIMDVLPILVADTEICGEEDAKGGT
ncbi:MAG: NAD-glutamate dehydrogenase [Simkaniaceae bacterium]|nr:NAD-glutamate dehydrogenase [Simkaniaceae bacterium]